MLLTVAEAAKRRKTTRFSIHRWLRAGLRHRRIGPLVVIDQRDLDRFTPRPVGNPKFKRTRRPTPPPAATPPRP